MPFWCPLQLAQCTCGMHDTHLENLDGFAKEEEQLTDPEPRKPEVRLRNASIVALCRHHGGLAQQRQRARLAAAMRGLVEQVRRKRQPLESRQPGMAGLQRVPSGHPCHPESPARLSRQTTQLMGPPPWIPVVTSPEVFAEGFP